MKLLYCIVLIYLATPKIIKQSSYASSGKQRWKLTCSYIQNDNYILYNTWVLPPPHPANPTPYHHILYYSRANLPHPKKPQQSPSPSLHLKICFEVEPLIIIVGKGIYGIWIILAAPKTSYCKGFPSSCHGS